MTMSMRYQYAFRVCSASAMRPADRPEYRNPPVVEVAIGLRFNRLTTFRQAHFGMFWAEVRDRYPRTVDRPKKQNIPLPIDGAVPTFQIEMADSAPTDLAWFSSADDVRLLQLQDDMLLLNWRKTDQSLPYPRFGELEPEFWRAWAALERVSSERPVPIEVEVTYVNRIDTDNMAFLVGYSPDQGNATSDLKQVAQRHAETFRVPEIGDRDGYLTVETTQAHSADGVPHYLMSLSLRCHVHAAGSDSQVSLGPVLDDASDLITRRFTALTTVDWHKKWDRI